MGITLTAMDTETAKKMIRSGHWNVTEASGLVYFNHKRWLRDVQKAEFIDETREILATLSGGDFVRLENSLGGK